MIRGILLILLVCTSSAFAGNAGSAILALRAVADQPYAADARIVELKGERADPMPAEWQILLADPSARGGVREVLVYVRAARGGSEGMSNELIEL